MNLQTSFLVWAFGPDQGLKMWLWMPRLVSECPASASPRTNMRGEKRLESILHRAEQFRTLSLLNTHSETLTLPCSDTSHQRLESAILSLRVPEHQAQTLLPVLGNELHGLLRSLERWPQACEECSSCWHWR